MEEADFNELSGQVEAVALMLNHLIAALEIEGAIDGEKFTSEVLHYSERRNHEKPWLPVAKRVVKAMVADLNVAREVRHKRKHLMKSQNH